NVTKENILKDDGFFIDEDDKELYDSPISDAIKVLFNVENEHDVDLSYLTGIGFYDKDGNFIGASTPIYYTDVDYNIPSGDNKNVDVLEFLPVRYEDVDKVDINVIGIEYDNN